VQCQISSPDDLWPVEVDEGQMSQVINNLILNASQAMPDGGVIQVRAENVSMGAGFGLPLEAQRYVKLTIKDQGMGIPEEHLPKIFDPYFTTKSRGSGLGLATTYSIIKRHDGHITVESALGVGTTFTIYLPASENILPRQPLVEAKPVKGHGRVLVMDDEAIVRDVTGHILRHLGYEAAFARDGAEALALYTQAQAAGTPFDVVIMDLTIPGGMGGKEAIRRLREIDPDVKAIVSSGYSDDPVMAKFSLYGFNDCVAKPYKIQDLSSALQRVIKGE
jgi:CheY-like chemotaxis protein